MTKPTNYQSQITQEDGFLIIDTASISAKKTYKFLSVLFICFISIFLISVLIYFIPTNADITFLAVIVLLFSGAISYLLFNIIMGFNLSTITIGNNKLIDTYASKIIHLKGIPSLDLRIQFLENKVNVQLDDVYFTLNNPEDLVIFTDALEREANIEFYENSKVNDTTIEVITYKAKNHVSPKFPSLLTIIKETQNINIYDFIKTYQIVRVYDLWNNSNWFEINPESKPLEIIYNSKFGFQEEILVSEIEKVIIKIQSKGGIINKPILKVIIIKNQKEFLIFKTNFRKLSEEITNRRDGEKLYELFKDSPAFQNIEIEKEIIS